MDAETNAVLRAGTLAKMKAERKEGRKNLTFAMNIDPYLAIIASDLPYLVGLGKYAKKLTNEVKAAIRAEGNCELTHSYKAPAGPEVLVIFAEEPPTEMVQFLVQRGFRRSQKSRLEWRGAGDITDRKAMIHKCYGEITRIREPLKPKSSIGPQKPSEGINSEGHSVGGNSHNASTSVTEADTQASSALAGLETPFVGVSESDTVSETPIAEPAHDAAQEGAFNFAEGLETEAQDFSAAYAPSVISLDSGEVKPVDHEDKLLTSTDTEVLLEAIDPSFAEGRGAPSKSSILRMIAAETEAVLNASHTASIIERSPVEEIKAEAASDTNDVVPMSARSTTDESELEAAAESAEPSLPPHENVENAHLTTAMESPAEIIVKLSSTGSGEGAVESGDAVEVLATKPENGSDLRPLPALADTSEDRGSVIGASKAGGTRAAPEIPTARAGQGRPRLRAPVRNEDART